MDFKDKFNQKELGYIYDRGKDLAKAHPDLAEKYRKMIQEHPYFKTLNEAKDYVSHQNKEDICNYQIWAKVGKDEEYYFIEDYYIATDNVYIKIAADYIGMEQIV